MPSPDERIDALVAAAVAGDLTGTERDELRRLAAEHPWIDDEIERLSAVAARVRDADVAWTDAVVTESLRERILGEIPMTQAPQQRVSPRQRRWVLPLVGAACLAVGLAIGAAVPGITSAPQAGEAGTLGAYEQLVVAEETGIDVHADLVAHTWGTEAVLDVAGLQVGATYRVVFIGDDGTEFPAGEMLGSAVEIHCRLNSAVLREQTVRMEIRDAGSAVVASADLPHV